MCQGSYENGSGTKIQLDIIVKIYKDLVLSSQILKVWL